MSGERTIRCTTCLGSGEMESSDSTDDCIYKCWACAGTGKIADRRKPDPALAGDMAKARAEQREWTIRHAAEFLSTLGRGDLAVALTNALSVTGASS